ncbi:MAG: hypothetical protein IIB38_06405 [Candidatus Hydrogenedentes bacterium]|nr:hypothetical protein [Candidatus Hydrogenedentota bacterium]
MSSLSLKGRPHAWLRRDESGNCLLWGCLSLFCFTVLVCIAGALIFRYGFVKFRDNFTEPTRAPLAVVEISDGDLEKLMKRVDEFTQGLDDGERPASLTLDETEVNALIQHHPDYETIKGNVFVTIDDNLIGGQVSFSLNDIPGLKGRYLNATAVFDVAFENGVLSIFLKDATVKGEPLPEMLMEALRSENLAEEVQDDRHLTEILDSLESFEVKNGKVTLTPKK